MRRLKKLLELHISKTVCDNNNLTVGILSENKKKITSI